MTFLRISLMRLSPRPWGRTDRLVAGSALGVIVPTPVGVNRNRRGGSALRPNCPHARGGEPIAVAAFRMSLILSPRPWG